MNYGVIFLEQSFTKAGAEREREKEISDNFWDKKR